MFQEGPKKCVFVRTWETEHLILCSNRWTQEKKRLKIFWTHCLPFPVGLILEHHPTGHIQWLRFNSRLFWERKRKRNFWSKFGISTPSHSGSDKRLPSQTNKGILSFARNFLFVYIFWIFVVCSNLSKPKMNRFNFRCSIGKIWTFSNNVNLWKYLSY